MASQLTNEQIGQFKSLMRIFFPAENTNQPITSKELGAVMRKIGLTPTELELQDMINEVDLDGNGAIDFDEFLTMLMHKMKEPSKENELREVFRVFDLDDDGFIGVEDLTTLMIQMGEKLHSDEIDDMLTTGDKDGDGRVSYDDFCDMMTPL